MYFHKYKHVCAYVYLYKNYTTSHYNVLMGIHKYIIIHTLLSIQILMSVVMVQTLVPKHVQTLMEASLVDVILVMNWTLMGLLVIVSTYLCTIMIINLRIHTRTNIHAYQLGYLLAKHINKYICMYQWRIQVFQGFQNPLAKG